MEAIKVKMTTCNSELDKCLEDEKKPWAKYLALAEAKTNVPRKYLFLGESPPPAASHSHSRSLYHARM